MSGGNAAIPRVGCAMSVTSRHEFSGPSAGTRHRRRLGDDPAGYRRVNMFLAELGQAVVPGAHGIVRMDGVGCHTAGDLVVPENLSLVFLPPYSPELNPIERLWLHLRDTIRDC
jgi:DDE superfamily endonuclease